MISQNSNSYIFNELMLLYLIKNYGDEEEKIVEKMRNMNFLALFLF